MYEIALLLVGALLGFIVTLSGESLISLFKRRNPIVVIVERSSAPPAWFATKKSLPSTIEEASQFDNEIKMREAFCGFGKINVRIQNISNDVVYINNITVTKDEIEETFDTRVFFITQGGCGPIRLNAVLDDERVVFAETVGNRHTLRGDFFSNANRIKVLPGEEEIICLGFIAVEKSWRFNCDIHYSIKNSSKMQVSIFGDDETIVPFLPDLFKRDYCSFYEFNGISYENIDEVRFFTEQMRDADPEMQRAEAASTIEYLSAFL